MRVLKQSTAVTVLLGPYIDKTDGFTEETGLAGAGTEISKAGAAFGAGPVLGTHDSDGWYPISLTTTHTNTLGDLTIKGHDNATHLPVWMHFTVLPANSFDALVSGSGVGMRSDVQGWLGSAVAAVTNAGVPEVDITHIAGAAVSTSTAQLGVNAVQAGGTAWGSGAITAASIATGAIDADAIADNAIDSGAIATGAITAGKFAAGAIDAAAVAADAGTEIATAVWASAARTLTALDEDSTTLDLDATIRGAVGMASANLDTQIGDLPTNAELATALGTADDAVLAQIALVKAKTDNLPTDPADQSLIIAATDAIIAAVGDVPTNAELATALGTADDAVLTAIGDLPTNAELATALAGADDAVLSAIAGLNNFDPATQEVLANVKKVNDVALTGDGGDTPWGPAS